MHSASLKTPGPHGPVPAFIHPYMSSFFDRSQRYDASTGRIRASLTLLAMLALGIVVLSANGVPGRDSNRAPAKEPAAKPALASSAPAR
jgi:hypothetical protein